MESKIVKLTADYSLEKSEFLDYAKKHKLHSLITELLVQCFQNNADDPKRFIVQMLSDELSNDMDLSSERIVTLEEKAEENFKPAREHLEQRVSKLKPKDNEDDKQPPPTVNAEVCVKEVIMKDNQPKAKPNTRKANPNVLDNSVEWSVLNRPKRILIPSNRLMNCAYQNKQIKERRASVYPKESSTPNSKSVLKHSVKLKTPGKPKKAFRKPSLGTFCGFHKNPNEDNADLTVALNRVLEKTAETKQKHQLLKY